jgi:glycosyltransferase involved in cell wall biosynthesis
MDLLTGGLEANEVDVRYSEKFVFLPITRGVLRHRDVDVVQLEWLYPFYTIDDLEFEPANRALTFLRAVALLVDLTIVALLPVYTVRTVHNKRHHDRAYPRIERVLNELVFALASAVVVKCERAVGIIDAEYRAADPDRMYVVSDGSYAPTYENEVSRGRARDELSIPDDAFVYLYFGLIRGYKGVPDLLRAYTALERSDTQLWIVGNPDSEELEREIRDVADRTTDVTTVFEYVPGERIQHFMNAADVLVLPYRDILNSGTTYAGLTFGLPIVAPRIGCIPETVSAENDLLYDPDQPNGLRSALETVYEHPDLESVGETNYERAIGRSWDRVGKEYLGVYRSLSEDRSRLNRPKSSPRSD